MNVLDVVLVIAALSFAISGYRQGFIVGVLSFAGFLGGGMVGLLLLPRVLERFFEPGLTSSIAAILIVFAAATIMQVFATYVGGQLKRYITWHPARLVDATAGGLAGAVSLLLVAWFIGTAVASASLPVVSRQVRESEVLTAISRVMPPGADSWFASFSQLLDRNGFPQVFGPYSQERIVQVPPPDERVLATPAVRRAQHSIVKVLGTARECSREIEGTGFVYAPRRVMTNAHVVAGVRNPVVLVRGERPALRARVVLFDPRRDVAVLYVPELRAPALRFDRTGGANDNAVVAGFPRNAPSLQASPARIRSVLNAQGRDIYERDIVVREVFSLFAVVQPGNSGGPLLDTDGEVYGVIFAKSLDDDQTGYALTADEVARDAQLGRTRTEPVYTGGCA
ncbi:colicin V synthesis protein [Carbonactinospora thermoautotrophica]|uniref:Colicin V synthesis protein n=2 Tax=Carbonactinospora thermoautotrophica TaxID=1469144 RepID=A0A132MLJ2_9ACTN|nr:MarP family serine protease [Carbonactinospora thermoautotrophica]KWW97459.1 colicin V synthesis protein [Carbonactinospora thermoautotrophica]KWW98730.1 Peptidase S1 and S6 chymotrypsin/Hap [Carbonactinospora thermoautotrophica]